MTYAGGEPLQPRRVISHLRELQALTSDASGAQRVAFTPAWAAARAWLREKADALPVRHETDAAANAWITLPGRSSAALVIGSHLDSVPGGGWLDGCLGVVAGLEVVRRIASQGTPPVTIRLVDWADEEGARFGRSLFGSSAASGALDPNMVRGLTDGQGMRLEEVVAAFGVDMDTIGSAHAHLADCAAYIELHIEQGPVLENAGLPLGVVLGTVGIERHVISLRGQTAHAGSTPMPQRRDAFVAAARLALAARESAVHHGGVATVGSCATTPGIPTAVAGGCEITLDQRHLDAGALSRMLGEVRDAAGRIGAEEGVSMEWRTLWRIEPTTFHPDLIDLAGAAVRDVAGAVRYLASGPLHDAAEMTRAGIPTAMLFVQSLRGLSHTAAEDTSEQHLELAVTALDQLADRTMRWILDAPPARR